MYFGVLSSLSRLSASLSLTGMGRLAQIKAEGDTMEITLNVGSGHTVKFSDKPVEEYMVSIHKPNGERVVAVNISKDDLRRVVKAS